jgi:hypothetical protein
VRNEVNRILGKDTLKGAEKRLAAACKSLVMKDGELSSEDVVNAISIVESKNGKKRLTNLLKFKDVSYIVLICLCQFQRLPDSHCLYIYHGKLP